MGKFNRTAPPAPVTSPVRTTGAAVTAEGGAGSSRDDKSELYLLAVANMVGEGTFYERAGRDSRFVTLVQRVASEDPAWLQGFIPYLRTAMFMRSAALVAAAQYAMVGAPGSRAVVAAALQRADEPGEFLAYIRSQTGSAQLGAGAKRGVADAVRRLYTQRAALKYGGEGSRDFTLADVVELVHPRPQDDTQGALFRYLLDRRHGRRDPRTEGLDMVNARRALDQMPSDQRAAFVAAPDAADRMRAAGVTWEYLGGWLPGGWTADAWASVIPTMGVMALIRNLRNFDKVNLPGRAVQQVIAKITSQPDILASRTLPFRFLAAYRATENLEWSYPLEQAVNLSLANTPRLEGNTLVLVDRSGSMFWDRVAGDRSQLSRADAAAIFGAALALRAEKATLVQFGTSSAVIQTKPGDSLLKVVERFGDLGGTNTATALRQHYAGHDRVVVVTDEQAHDGAVGSAISANVPLYTWNLAGYKVAHGESGVANRHTFGGLSDAAFSMIPLLEARRSGAVGWPWES